MVGPARPLAGGDAASLVDGSPRCVARVRSATRLQFVVGFWSAPLIEAGFPEGVLNVVTGFGEPGAALAAHDGVDKVSFTGSTEVGRAIVRASAGNLKRVSLELGGKSPNIVLPDANIETVAAEVADAIFFNQGQVCTAGSRLYVHRDCYDQVIDGVADIARRMKIGPGARAEQDASVSRQEHLSSTGLLLVPPLLSRSN